jgi:hypothetical protein
MSVEQLNVPNESIDLRFTGEEYNALRLISAYPKTIAEAVVGTADENAVSRLKIMRLLIQIQNCFQRNS